MEIKSISTVEHGIGVFRGEHGLVETTDGQQFVYTFEFSDTWKDLEDYLDNVRSDFENERDCKDFGEFFDDEDYGLFLRKELWEK